MRYLVTGCAGFIGSTVAALLLNQEHEVIGIDNLNDAYDVRLKEWPFGTIKWAAKLPISTSRHR